MKTIKNVTSFDGGLLRGRGGKNWPQKEVTPKKKGVE